MSAHHSPGLRVGNPSCIGSVNFKTLRLGIGGHHLHVCREVPADIFEVRKQKVLGFLEEAGVVRMFDLRIWSRTEGQTPE